MNLRVIDKGKLRYHQNSLALTGLHTWVVCEASAGTHLESGGDKIPCPLHVLNIFGKSVVTAFEIHPQEGSIRESIF